MEHSGAVISLSWSLLAESLRLPCGSRSFFYWIFYFLQGSQLSMKIFYERQVFFMTNPLKFCELYMFFGENLYQNLAGTRKFPSFPLFFSFEDKPLLAICIFQEVSLTFSRFNFYIDFEFYGLFIYRLKWNLIHRKVFCFETMSGLRYRESIEIMVAGEYPWKNDNPIREHSNSSLFLSTGTFKQLSWQKFIIRKG